LRRNNIKSLSLVICPNHGH